MTDDNGYRDAMAQWGNPYRTPSTPLGGLVKSMNDLDRRMKETKAPLQPAPQSKQATPVLFLEAAPAAYTKVAKMPRPKPERMSEAQKEFLAKAGLVVLRMFVCFIAAWLTFYAPLIAMEEVFGWGAVEVVLEWIKSHGDNWLRLSVIFGLTAFYYFRAEAIGKAIAGIAKKCGAALKRAAKRALYKIGMALVEFSRK